MAVAIRGTTPATNASTGAPSVTLSGTRQPATDDVLLIICGDDYYLLSDIGTPTVGGSTTGVTAVTGGSADGGQFFAHCKAWTKVITSGGSDLTVAMVDTLDEEKCIAVYVLSGADTSTPIDIAGGNFDSTGSTNHVAPSVTATVAGFLICHANDGNGASSGTSTPPSGMTEQYDAVLGGAMAYTGATVQLGGSGATGTKTFAKTGNATYATLSIVIKPAAGGTNATATPSAVTGSAVVPAPTITAQTNRTPTPSAVAGSAVVPAPTVSAQSNATISAGTVAGAATLPTATIAAQSNATATPAALAGAATVPAPAVSTGGNATAAPGVVSATVVIPTPAVTAQSNATATPSAVTGSATVPTPTVSAQSNANATPSVVSATVVIPTPVVTAILHATIAAAVLARSVVIPTPTVIAAQAGAGVIGNIGDLDPDVLGGLAPVAAYAVAGSVG